MKRRKFLISSLTAAPVLATGMNIIASPPRTTKGFVVKAGASRFGEQTKIGGTSPNDIKVSSKDTDGGLTVFEYVGNVKGGPPLHVHPNQDEIFFVQAGNYLFQVGEEKHQLSAGDLIFLPRNVPHTFAQLTDQGKMLFFFQPSGKMEDYFRVLGGLKAQPSPAEGAKIFADHDMQVMGPPLAY